MWVSTSARTSSRSSPSIVSSQSGYTFAQTNSKGCTNHLSIYDCRRSYRTTTTGEATQLLPLSTWKIFGLAATRSPHTSSKRASTPRVVQGVNMPTEAPPPSACVSISRARHCPTKSGRSCETDSVITSKSLPPTHDLNIATGRWLAGEWLRGSQRPWSTRQSEERRGPPEHLREEESRGNGREDGQSVSASLPTSTCDQADILPQCP